MASIQDDLKNRPIRVVLFGGGPVLERGVREFISRLEDHPEIDFLGGFCQSQGQALWDIMRDLWNRRGFLAAPILVMNIGSALLNFIRQTSKETKLDRKIKRLSDRLHFVPDIHADEVLSQVRDLKPDLGLIYSSPILKPQLFERPGFGTLGIHHGKLPEYRGKKTVFWAMYNGESTADVTIQKVNAGLDTGEIVRQGNVAIDNRSLGSVWRDLESLGLDLYIQAILEVKRGTASYLQPVGKKGKLYHDPKLSQIIIFWLKQLNRGLRVFRLLVNSRSPNVDRGFGAGEEN